MQLIIDTVSPWLSVAVIAPDGTVRAHHSPLGRGHAERLIPLIDSLLDGGRPTAIRVNAGPGSFTGVRIGLAAARALAFGYGATLSGYHHLEHLDAAAQRQAPNWQRQDRLIAIPGGHGEFFVGSFAAGATTIIDVHSMRPEALAAAQHGRPLAALPIVGFDGPIAMTLDPPAPHEAATLRPIAAEPIYGRGADATPMATA